MKQKRLLDITLLGLLLVGCGGGGSGGRTGGISGSGGKPAGSGGTGGKSTGQGGSAGQGGGGGAVAGTGGAGSGNNDASPSDSSDASGGDASGSDGGASPPLLQNGIDETAMDKAVNPCENFYQFACGGYLKTAQIPETEFLVELGNSAISKRSRELHLQMLADFSAGPLSMDAPEGKKVGDFFQSCIEIDRKSATAITELSALLKKVDAVTTVPALFTLLGDMHRASLANAGFWDAIRPDKQDSSKHSYSLSQGGRGLDDAAYYKETSPEAVEVQTEYRAYMGKVLTGSGFAAAEATRMAGRAYDVERRLALVSRTNQEINAGQPVYLPKTRAQLKTLSPTIPWDVYLAAVGLTTVATVVLEDETFVSGLDALVRTGTLADWRDYLRWRTADQAAPFVSAALYKVWADFNLGFMRGVAATPTPTDRCLAAVGNSSLANALAIPFASRTLGSAGRTRAVALGKNVAAAMRTKLERAAWLDANTQSAAIKKLEALTQNVGYPDKDENLVAHVVDPAATFLGNTMTIDRTNWEQSRDRLTKPVDRGSWNSNVSEINASYEASRNQIRMLAGILQKPHFDANITDAANYGAAGAIFGHEITHAFDGYGSKFGPTGNLENWFTPASSDAFAKRSQCLVDQFMGYFPLPKQPDLPINGQATLGENLADLEGLRIAYAAYKTATAGQPPQARGTMINDDQIFFVSYAQSWCGKWTDQLLAQVLKSDPHTPPEYRTNGPLSNMPEFASTFTCAPTTKMVRATKCEVW